MQRRKFLRIAGISIFAISTSAYAFKNKSNTLLDDCATSSDALGPKFREGAPFRNNLFYKRQKGMLLNVTGVVYAADCCTPIKGVIIDIWHCDHKGWYDMHSPKYKCRGKIKTDIAGNYSFNTIVPKHYSWRPKHIHYLIRDVKGHEQLITQLYFAGDERINAKTEHDHYPYDDKRILEGQINEAGTLEVRLDLFLTAKIK